MRYEECVACVPVCVMVGLVGLVGIGGSVRGGGLFCFSFFKRVVWGVGGQNRALNWIGLDYIGLDCIGLTDYPIWGF